MGQRPSLDAQIKKLGYEKKGGDELSALYFIQTASATFWQLKILSGPTLLPLEDEVSLFQKSKSLDCNFTMKGGNIYVAKKGSNKQKRLKLGKDIKIEGIPVQLHLVSSPNSPRNNHQNKADKSLSNKSSGKTSVIKAHTKSSDSKSRPFFHRSPDSVTTIVVKKTSMRSLSRSLCSNDEESIYSESDEESIYSESDEESIYSESDEELLYSDSISGSQYSSNEDLHGSYAPSEGQDRSDSFDQSESRSRSVNFSSRSSRTYDHRPPSYSRSHSSELCIGSSISESRSDSSSQSLSGPHPGGHTSEVTGTSGQHPPSYSRSQSSSDDSYEDSGSGSFTCSSSQTSRSTTMTYKPFQYHPISDESRTSEAISKAEQDATRYGSSEESVHSNRSHSSSCRASSSCVERVPPVLKPSTVISAPSKRNSMFLMTATGMFLRSDCGR